MFTASVIALSLVSTNAFAWGAREQGIVTGVAGLWVFQQLQKAGEQQQQQPVIVQQQPVIIQQQPIVVQPQQYCETAQVQDQFGTYRAFKYCYYK